MPPRFEPIASPRKGSYHAVEQDTRQVIAIIEPLVKKLETQVKTWTRSTTDSVVGGAAADLVKGKQQLIMENTLLRRQVIVLKRGSSAVDSPYHGLFVVMASQVKESKIASLIVKPETILRWHRSVCRFSMIYNHDYQGPLNGKNWAG